LANLRFALAVEPDNRALNEYQASCHRLREAGQATLPSTIGLELQINPFLRSEQASICDSAQRRDPAARTPVEVFAALRQWKNEFR
jgi:hydroxyacylglutathione hydrolase